ncbi:transmembrane amino acid transporter protein-domain-containing protein [Dimargaris cristalligena]|uniref:Transmembrane amino acid transporter protein-domain-containing protein n=1 Tax=Dimargaris cristalligena TaxID=215637 RepID=A0A4P9ZKR3_9FUNG|nr:transmembrane amino acid transporter protein-domain-containing protein [Dimargaris cristalligena]|eukprot:RKP33837.1 transmembrane amino acid transporter protein-domain-containing protein [Dimargaris cristalligena]
MPTNTTILNIDDHPALTDPTPFDQFDPLKADGPDQGSDFQASAYPQLIQTAESSVLGSFFNMTNAIVGAGIIGLPFAFKEAGYFTGMILLLTLAYITDWTLRLLAHATKLSGRSTYQELVCFCFGRIGFHAISFFQFVFAFGGMCAFNVIIGDTVPHVIRSVVPGVLSSPVLTFLTSRRAMITLITLFISFPLSLYRDMGKLAKTSALALVAMLVIVVAVVIEAPKAAPELRGNNIGKWAFMKPDVFQAIGVMGFAFVCHHNSFMIYSALKTPTLDRYARVIRLSTILSATVCLVLASVGYLNFTDKTRGNILNNFPDNNLLINIARFCFGFNMITTFPMELLVAREVIDGYVSLYSQPKSASNHTEVPFSMTRHVGVTTAMVLATLFVALSVCDLGIIIELTGGVSATALAFILPAACHLKLGSGPLLTRAKLPLWLLLGFGICVLFLSPTLAIYRFIHQDPSEMHIC